MDASWGVHIAGRDAAEIIQAASIAVTMGATKADFDLTIAVHPTVAEELISFRTPIRFTTSNSLAIASPSSFSRGLLLSE